MGTRQLRLINPEEIRRRLPAFAGKKINVVLNDQTVVLVTFRSIEKSAAIVLNMRLKEISIPLDSIYEIYFDTKE